MPTGVYLHKPLSKEHKRKLSETHMGEKHWNWKGGISKNKEYLRIYAREHSRKYRKNNLEHLREYQKNWRKNHLERTKEYWKKYSSKNLNKLNEKNRKWRENNPKYFTFYFRNRYRNDPVFRERIKKYSLENRKHKHLDQHYAREHKYRALRNNADGSFTAEDWQEILKKNHFKCVLCGSTEHITRDHIIPISRGGTNFSTNLQPLCRSCNSRKNNKI